MGRQGIGQGRRKRVSEAAVCPAPQGYLHERKGGVTLSAGGRFRTEERRAEGPARRFVIRSGKEAQYCGSGLRLTRTLSMARCRTVGAARRRVASAPGQLPLRAGRRPGHLLRGAEGREDLPERRPGRSLGTIGHGHRAADLRAGVDPDPGHFLNPRRTRDHDRRHLPGQAAGGPVPAPLELVPGRLQDICKGRDGGLLLGGDGELRLQTDAHIAVGQ